MHHSSVLSKEDLRFFAHVFISVMSGPDACHGAINEFLPEGWIIPD